MSKRDKKRAEQDRRKVAQQGRREPLGGQATDNKRRVEYMMDNYSRISNGVEKFKRENDGRMPAIIVLAADIQQIIIADKLEPFVAALEQFPEWNLEALKHDIVKRNYADDDCLLLVGAGRGVLRTSFANAKLRHDLGDEGPEFVSVAM